MHYDIHPSMLYIFLTTERDILKLSTVFVIVGDMLGVLASALTLNDFHAFSCKTSNAFFLITGINY